ncbi:MAG: metalloregulator ArsR/SmtB family transcription factor [Polyangiaceae bacterium]
MPATLDRTLGALADSTRRAVVTELLHGPTRPSELAERLGVSRPALSRHLRVLRHAGLVSERVLTEDARGHILELQRRPFDQLREWLTEVEGLWTVQLGAFKQYAEKKARRKP